jgi:hypothetical protein
MAMYGFRAHEALAAMYGLRLVYSDRNTPTRR